MPWKAKEKRLEYWNKYRELNREKIRLYQVEYQAKRKKLGTTIVKQREYNDDYTPRYYTDRGCKKATAQLGKQSSCLTCTFPLGFSEDCS